MRQKFALAMAAQLALLVVQLVPGLAMSDQVRGMCQQAEQLINSRRFNDAISLLQQAGSMDPSCAEVHGYLGMAYQNSGNTSQAVREYQQALQLNPQMSFLNVNLGNCFLNLNQPEQAVPYFQQYLQQNPNAPDAAQVRMSIQQAGARGGQQNLRSVVEQGQSFLNNHRYNEARQAFEQAISIKPDFAPAHFFLGYALANSGQQQRAIQEFQTALQLDPSMKQATVNIASNYQSMGDCNSAIEWYEKYLRENPGAPNSGDIRNRINGLRQQAAKQGGTPRQPAQPPAQSDYLDAVSSQGKYFRWSVNQMPVRVFIAPGTGSPGYRDSFGRDLADAFIMWAKGSENRLAFLFVQDPAQADIVCGWTGDPNRVQEAGRSVEGGLTKLSGQPQPDSPDVWITRASITILTKDRGGTALTDDDMKKVCLHEVGHALGLNGHSNDNHDVMFFSESPTVWPALSKRDKATILRLYEGYPQTMNAQPMP